MDEVYSKLFHAARWGHSQIVKDLLEEGLDPNMKTGRGKTAIFSAAQGGSEENLRLLLDYGANVNQVDSSGKTVLFYSLDSKTNVHMLVKYGADVNHVDNTDTSLLSFAIQRASHDVVEYLVKLGADINRIDNKGRNVLFDAVHSRGMAVELLLKSGININQISYAGNSVLIEASGLDSEESDIVEDLLKNGAIIDHVNYSGNSASDFAEVRGHHEILELIRRFSIKRNAKRKFQKEVSLLWIKDQFKQLQYPELRKKIYPEDFDDMSKIEQDSWEEMEFNRTKGPPLGGMRDFKTIGESQVMIYDNANDCEKNIFEIFGSYVNDKQLFFYIQGLKGKNDPLPEIMPSREELCREVMDLK